MLKLTDNCIAVAMNALPVDANVDVIDMRHAIAAWANEAMIEIARQPKGSDAPDIQSFLAAQTRALLDR